MEFEEAQEAREIAHQLLLAYRQQHPQWKSDKTPLDELTSWLGLEVETFHVDDYPTGTYGFLEPQENLIWLRRDLSPTLRRFTLAHELGHAILHRKASQRVQPLFDAIRANQPTHLSDQGASPEDPCQTLDVREEILGSIFQEQAEEVLGLGVSYDPRSQRELAANIFAAELLMPLERVRALYLSQEIPPTKLATIFDVSQSALLNRLTDLLTEPPPPSAGDRDSVGAGVGLRGEGTLASPAVRDHDSVGTLVSPSSPDEALSSIVRAGAVDEVGRGPLRSPSSPRDLSSQPDEFQQAAIAAPTPALIVAGPGSGKTSTLIGRAAYLIHTLDIAPQHILALTFSRKAAQEMQERLQKVLNPDMPPPTVSTFHAFCAELLRTHGALVGLRQDFAFIDDAEGYFLLRRLAAELPLRHYQNLFNPAASFPTILSAISRAKDELTTPTMYTQLAQNMLAQAQNEKEQEAAEKALEIADIYALYQQRLEYQGDTDFGGLIMLAVQLLQEHPDVRAELHGQYEHILVDEFQDINRASGVLLRLLAGEARRVWVVGDANQAIYGFRGASPANIANFRDDYPDAAILPLSRNYRSRPDIVNIADAFRCTNLEPESQQGTVQTTRATHTDPYITLATAADEASEINGIIDDMRHKHSQGYAYRDMVVLCRTRKVARTITRALIAANLPVIERGGMLEQEHIKSLLSVIMLLTDSGGMGILRAAGQSDHPFSQADIEALLYAVHTSREQGQKRTLTQLILHNDAPPPLSVEGRRSLMRLSTILNALRYTPSNMWSLIAQYLFIETSIGRGLLASLDEPGQAQANALRADYTSLLQMARYYDQQQQILRQQEAQQATEPGEEIESPDIREQAKGFLDYLSVLLTLRQDGGSRRESEENNGEETPDVIRVMTVHASKGLEFPIVYLSGITNQRFPLQRRAHAAPPPRGMLAAQSDEAATHETGEACLFYVGATRARDHLIISYADRYGKKKYKRSSYIDALVAGLPTERVTRLIWQNNAENPPSEDEESPESVSSRPVETFIEAMKPQTLRASDIETYQRCPRQYLYSSIYRFRSESAAYQLFRKATQQTLDALQKQIETLKEEENGVYPTAQQARELYTLHWHSHEGHTTPFGPMYEQHGHEVAELLRRKLIESGDTHWQLYPNYTVEIAGKTIEVAVDRVESSTLPNQQVKFVKTGFGRRKEKIDPTTRELLYTRAYRQHHPGQPIELHFHNMSTGETFEIKLTERKEQSLYNALEEALASLDRNEFPPKPDPFVCPGCAFFLICPA